MRDDGHMGRRVGRRAGFGLVAFVAVALASCGGGDDAAGPGTSVTAAPSTSAAQIEKAKPAPGTGNVQGRVLFDDQPAAGIEVKLCETFARFGSGCSGAQHMTRTEADGQYVIADVPPMEYQGLLVRVFDSDLFQFAQSGFVSAKTYVVEADRTLFVEPTHLYKADLQVREPASGTSVAPGGVQVRWDAYPNAAYYELTLRPEAAGSPSPVSKQRVDGTSYTPTATLPSGTYRIIVEAFNAKSRKLAEGPERYSFTVAG